MTLCPWESASLIASNGALIEALIAGIKSQHTIDKKHPLSSVLTRENLPGKKTKLTLLMKKSVQGKTLAALARADNIQRLFKAQKPMARKTETATPVPARTNCKATPLDDSARTTLLSLLAGMTRNERNIVQRVSNRLHHPTLNTTNVNAGPNIGAPFRDPLWEQLLNFVTCQTPTPARMMSPQSSP